MAKKVVKASRKRLKNPKRKNPQDTTLRNNRARTREFGVLRDHMNDVDRRQGQQIDELRNTLGEIRSNIGKLASMGGRVVALEDRLSEVAAAAREESEKLRLLVGDIEARLLVELDDVKKAHKALVAEVARDTALLADHVGLEMSMGGGGGAVEELKTDG